MGDALLEKLEAELVQGKKHAKSSSPKAIRTLGLPWEVAHNGILINIDINIAIVQWIYRNAADAVVVLSVSGPGTKWVVSVENVSPILLYIACEREPSASIPAYGSIVYDIGVCQI